MSCATLYQPLTGAFLCSSCRSCLHFSAFSCRFRASTAYIESRHRTPHTASRVDWHPSLPFQPSPRNILWRTGSCTLNGRIPPNRGTHSFVEGGCRRYLRQDMSSTSRRRVDLDLKACHDGNGLVLCILLQIVTMIRKCLSSLL